MGLEEEQNGVKLSQLISFSELQDHQLKINFLPQSEVSGDDFEVIIRSKYELRDTQTGE